MLCFTSFYCRTTERPSHVHRTGGKLRRDAGRGTAGGGGQLPHPPVFGRSVNPIPTRGKIMPIALLLAPQIFGRCAASVTYIVYALAGRFIGWWGATYGSQNRAIRFALIKRWIAINGPQCPKSHNMNASPRPMCTAIFSFWALLRRNLSLCGF